MKKIKDQDAGIYEIAELDQKSKIQLGKIMQEISTKNELEHGFDPISGGVYSAYNQVTLALPILIESKQASIYFWTSDMSVFTLSIAYKLKNLIPLFNKNESEDYCLRIEGVHRSKFDPEGLEFINAQIRKGLEDARSVQSATNKRSAVPLKKRKEYVKIGKQLILSHFLINSLPIESELFEAIKGFSKEGYKLFYKIGEYSKLSDGNKVTK